MKILSGVLFVLGMLLLGLTVLVFTGDAGAAAQIELGVCACNFFLAAIWLKMGAK